MILSIMRLLTYVLPILYCFLARQNRMHTRRVYGLKYIDHNMENKTIFDQFEYYSVIGDREKQMEIFREIRQHISRKKKP